MLRFYSYRVAFVLAAAEIKLERAMGIEPMFRAWEAPVLPLNHARLCPCCIKGLFYPKDDWYYKSPVLRIRRKNSSRAAISLRKTPSIALVTQLLSTLRAPRISMHMCRASTITATP